MRKPLTTNPGHLLASLDDVALKTLKQIHVNMPWRYLPDYLETVIEMQINVEIGLEAEQLDGVPRSVFRSVAENLHRAGCRITLHGPFWDLSPGSSDSLIRQVSQFRFHQLLDLVEVFQPIQVVCHTGYDPSHHGGHRDFYLERSLAIWEPLVARAEKSSVPLLLENVWEQGPEFHREFLTAIDSPCCGFCLDVGHQHSFSRTALSTWLETLGEFLREVHLHDNRGNHDDHLPVGQGTFDFESLFGLFRIRGISPLITLEPHREEHLVESLAGLAKVMGIDGGAMIA
jgi:sugar phosphate isomerase/epimerase